MGLQPRSQDLSLGFCSEAKGEVLGTGPVGGLGEVFTRAQAIGRGHGS